MSWQDRLRTAAYVAPNGARFTFDYLELTREFEKQTTAFNFPGVEGTFVQDLGTTDRRYPFRVVFWGQNHDTQAASFLRALRIRGAGVLEHPRDGWVSVFPFGRIRDREDLVTEANQTVIEVAFWESGDVLFPSGILNPVREVLSAVTGALNEASALFVRTADFTTPVEIVTIRNQLDNRLGSARSILGPLAETDAKIGREFGLIADSIEANLPTFETDPTALADQVGQLMQLPAQVTRNVGARLDGYSDLIDTVTGGGNPVRPSNSVFRADELFALTAHAGAVRAAVAADYQTRPGAVSAAANLSDQFDTINGWREQNYGAL